MVRGWAKNDVARLSKYKLELAAEYNDLDAEMENNSLSPAEISRMD